MYAVSFASLYAQIPGLDKIYPTKMLLDRITKDEPSRWDVRSFSHSG